MDAAHTLHSLEQPKPVDLSPDQLTVIRASLGSKIFLHGPSGSGKTTAGVERLRFLLSGGIVGDSLLILTPQRTLQEPYRSMAYSTGINYGTEISLATVGGLARRMCELFWPLVSEQAGFANPDRAPIFLTLETSQYYMAYIVRPLLDQGFFESVTMDRNRLYSQILDSLNKSSAVGFSYREIGTRLDSAWIGDQSQRRIYADAQECAARFREFCLQNNCLDFSLQLEVFWTYLWPNPLVHDYLIKTYRHLIYDNVEEDIPRTHDLICELMPKLESALLIFDEGAGYRGFLGADAESGLALSELCDTRYAFTRSFIMSPPVEDLGASLSFNLDPSIPRAPKPLAGSGGHEGLSLLTSRYYPELLDKMVDEIRSLVTTGDVAPGEVVVIAPYLSDALRFAITNRFEASGIPWMTHRPSRSLRDEPAARALLTLAALAHPHWNVQPPKFDLVRALMTTLQMDLVRAHLLTEIVYRLRDFTLSSFDQIKPEKQDRISSLYGTRYSHLRDWLLNYRQSLPNPLDLFLRRLFGELLSQPGFGFHRDLDAARIAGSLIESVRKFRSAVEPSVVEQDHPDFDIGKEYFTMLHEGILAAQYLDSWHVTGTNAVLVSPAYSFLMMNRPCTFQFWLDPGSNGWLQRLDQPLTHTRVLSRSWTPGRRWTHGDEEHANLESMTRLVLGLVRRCRQRIFLCISNLGETGFEQRGRLLAAFQSVLREENAT